MRVDVCQKPQVKNKSQIINELSNVSDVNFCVSVHVTCNCADWVHKELKLAGPDVSEFTDKSRLELRRICIYDVKNQCGDLHLMLQQQKTGHGFVPLTDLQCGYIKSCTKNVVNKQLCQDPIALYRAVAESSLPNFIGARIQINFTMNLDLLDSMLSDYWDWQLPLFLRYGFPMNFIGEISDLMCEEHAHKSAKQFPSHVEKYLEDEMQYGAIYGPFEYKPFGSLTHISPFITRTKTGSHNRRVIVDLSWPHEASVNTFTPENVYFHSAYRLQYPTVDDLTDRLIRLGPGAHMYKVDLARAFRQLPVDPGSFPYLCLYWANMYYIDASVAFGHRVGALGCSRLSQAIKYLHIKAGFNLICYLDDLFATEMPERASKGFRRLCDLLSELNIPISVNKLVAPTTCMECLGIVVDSVHQTLSIPSSKVLEILKKCQQCLALKQISKKGLQSLIGSLMFVHKAVRPARLFTNMLLSQLRQMTTKKIPVCCDMRRDIQWFITFLEKYNGKSQYAHVPLDNTDVVELDASLSGMGARFNNQVYKVQFVDVQLPCDMSIVHLEMYNILAACRVWGHVWQGRVIQVKCDNMAVVQVLQSGKTRDSTLACIARNIWLEKATHDFELVVDHIPGVDNVVADMLSRWQSIGSEGVLKSIIPDLQWVFVKTYQLLLNINI